MTLSNLEKLGTLFFFEDFNHACQNLGMGSDIFCFYMLQAQLNFQVQDVPPTEGVWGAHRNGSWTGMVGMKYMIHLITIRMNQI